MSRTLTSLQELDLYDVSAFDGKTLLELHALVCRKEYLESTPGFDFDHNEIPDLKFHDAPNEDLFLDFTLPGYPDFVLKPDKEDVSIDNLEEYISLVVVSIVKAGITRQMEAFKPVSFVSLTFHLCKYSPRANWIICFVVTENSGRLKSL